MWGNSDTENMVGNLSHMVLSNDDCESNWGSDAWNFKSSRVSSDFTGWIPPVIISLAIVIACSCFLTICTSCCTSCRTREETSPTEEPTVRVSIPPPPFSPFMPSAPPVNQSVEPPPYTEVAWKPYIYPPPTGQPPAYDNIAIDPPLDDCRPPTSAPKDSS
nr:PREDICTED: transmembrane protein 92 [Anolis carolinensis]|eukprot:XP_016850185.1 PREDICTED: transmembrane protein 92 [Anolis carolinensis]